MMTQGQMRLAMRKLDWSYQRAAKEIGIAIATLHRIVNDDDAFQRANHATLTTIDAGFAASGISINAQGGVDLK